MANIEAKPSPADSEACCAHSTVKLTYAEHPGGTRSDIWSCIDCGTRFLPASHFLAMRIQDGKKQALERITIGALQTLLRERPGYADVGEEAVKVAKQALAALEKE